MCDRACGCASSWSAALQYMTDVLYKSRVYPRRIKDHPEDGSSLIAITLPFGTPSQARLEEELIPVRTNAARFEAMMKARLRRYLVERCLYGVDLSPLAAEMAHLIPLLATSDPESPLTS